MRKPVSKTNSKPDRSPATTPSPDIEADLTATRAMNLYYVVTPENTFAVVAAPDLATAQEIPPYSNWRDLMAFGGWDAEYGKRCKITCIANPSTLDPDSTPGVLLAGGMGFYSQRENAVKFI